MIRIRLEAWNGRELAQLLRQIRDILVEAERGHFGQVGAVVGGRRVGRRAGQVRPRNLALHGIGAARAARYRGDWDGSWYACTSCCSRPGGIRLLVLEGDTLRGDGPRLPEHFPVFEAVVGGFDGAGVAGGVRFAVLFEAVDGSFEGFDDADC